jgi:hypothetical protein
MASYSRSRAFRSQRPERVAQGKYALGFPFSEGDIRDRRWQPHRLKTYHDTGTEFWAHAVGCTQNEYSCKPLKAITALVI